MRARAMRRKGFTLIESMIVMMYISILALIAIPNITDAGRSAREAQLRANLRELRAAVESYRAELGGQPEKLGHLMRKAKKPPAYCLVAPDGRRIPILARDYRGPYLTTPNRKLPLDPMTGKRNWKYTKKTGAIRSRSRTKGLDGTKYSTW